MVLAGKECSQKLCFCERLPRPKACLHARDIVLANSAHGGFDGGAVASDGTIEKDINLEISLKLNSILQFLGYKTVLVRSEDVSTEDLGDFSGSKKVRDIKNRLALTEKYENSILISIHMNKYSTSQPNGTQVFYSPNDVSKELADSIQESVKAMLQNNNKRVTKKATKDIYLLYHSKVPSVIVECGFLSNPSDLKNLKDEKYQSTLSWAVAEGIKTYLDTLAKDSN